MKIYTKTGDKGETGLYGGSRIPKNSPLIRTIGDVDELNASLGVVVSKINSKSFREDLLMIQRDLFVIGSDLATPLDVNKKLKVVRLDKKRISWLEERIDYYYEKLPEIRFFILPGGSEAGALLHLARAVCRRAERTLVNLYIEENLNPELKIYLNRLSDLLFATARYINYKNQVEEFPWKT